jgi:hypothetical protein
MKKIGVFLALAALFSVAGCGRGTLGGAAGGLLGAGAGYEYNFKRQIDKLDNDLKAGVIDQKEYDIRKNQIQRDSLIQ